MGNATTPITVTTTVATGAAMSTPIGAAMTDTVTTTMPTTTVTTDNVTTTTNPSSSISISSSSISSVDNNNIIIGAMTGIMMGDVGRLGSVSIVAAESTLALAVVSAPAHGSAHGGRLAARVSR